MENWESAERTVSTWWAGARKIHPESKGSTRAEHSAHSVVRAHICLFHWPFKVEPEARSFCAPFLSERLIHRQSTCQWSHQTEIYRAFSQHPYWHTESSLRRFCSILRGNGYRSSTLTVFHLNGTEPQSVSNQTVSRQKGCRTQDLKKLFGSYQHSRCFTPVT